MGGQVHRRTRAPNRRADGWADGRTGRRIGGRADGAGHTGRTSEQGQAKARTSGRRISEGKTPNLTRQPTWLWEIQCGRPRVTIKLPHLPPPSR